MLTSALARVICICFGAVWRSASSPRACTSLPWPASPAAARRRRWRGPLRRRPRWPSLQRSPGRTVAAKFPACRPAACNGRDRSAPSRCWLRLPASCAWRPANCCLATWIPARALFTSASVAETWLLVFTEVMGTLTPAASGGSLRIREVGFGALVGNLIIRGIDFHQHRSSGCTYWLSWTFSLVTWPVMRALTELMWPSIWASSVDS